MKLQSILFTSPFLVAGAALANPQDPEAPEAATPTASAASSEAAADPAASPWWPTWRGPDSSGVARTGSPPTRWSEKENIRWKVEIPGLGHSTPVVWEDRLYLMTAIELEPEAAKEAGGGGRSGRGAAQEHEFVVLCLDRADGGELWRRTVKRAVPHEGGHSTGSHASGSPITDGEHVFAFFGSRGLYCLDMQGEVVWSKNLGQMRTRNGFGEGASPALYGDTLVVNWDHEGESFIVALDKRSGDELWREERDEITTWTTPLIVPVGERPQVIVPATERSRAYDLESGKTVWSCTGMTQNCIPVPMYADGVAYLMSGFRGAALQAIRLEGAQGDITDGEPLLWTHDRNTSYTPSGVLYDGLIYFLRGNSGSLSCVDAATGEALYERQSLEGIRSVYSSLIAADGRVYATSRKGVTAVIAHGREFRELASNKLDDGFDASGVIVGDELYLRGTKHLYCIAEQPVEGGQDRSDL